MESEDRNNAPEIEIDDSDDDQSPINVGVQIEVVADDSDEKEEVKDDSKAKANKERQDYLDSLPTIAVSEVAKHQTKDDMWSAVDGLVYDLTTFIPKHPGGKKIMQGAGIECTELYNKWHEGVIL